MFLDALTQWKPEPRSIFQAKRHCFDKDPNNPSRLIYDQMALQAANDENEVSLMYVDCASFYLILFRIFNLKSP